MPSKTRHSQRKLSRRKRKNLPVSPLPATQQQADAQPYKPVDTPKVTTPSAGVPTPAPTRYPYIFTELRRIGILTGIILVILVVLFLVLP